MNPIYNAPMKEKLQDLIVWAQMALDYLEAGMPIRDMNQGHENMTDQEFAIGNWIVRPRFKDEK